MYEEFKGQFLGPLEIKDVLATKEKTYLRKEKVVLVLETEERKDLPLEIVKKIITKERSDWTELRERWVVPIVEKVLVILTESELGNNDLHYALDVKLGESIKMASDEAQKILFGKPKEEISLMDLERVFKRKKKKNADNNKLSK